MVENDPKYFPDRLYDQAQFKEMCGGKSDMWVWRSRKRGTIPEPIKVNGRNHWTASTLQKYFLSLSA